MAINEQSSDEELLRKEINRITAILRDLRKSGTKLDQGLLKNIASMTKTADAWGKQLTVATASIEKEKSMAARWADRSTAEMKALKLRKLMNTEAQASRKLLQQQKSDDVERHIKMRSAMGKASDSFNFFTKSLTKGLGFGEAIGMATEKLRQMSQAAMEQMKLEEMQKAYDDEAAKFGAGFEKDPKGEKAAHDLDEQKKLVAGLGGNTGGEGMGKMQKSLGKMGKFASKHAGGMLLGAGAGGLILGVIIKALSVAPMFQAMMKLFKFAVTMILMPIGTFFGAILRPIMIGLIKTIAPQFKGWMKTAMKLGDQVGKFIMDFFTDPAKYLLMAVGGVIPMMISAISKILPFAEETPEEKKKKEEEHNAYWKKFNDDMSEIGKSIMRPILTFIGYLNTLFIVIIPDALTGLGAWLSNGLEWIGKELLKPLWTFIGTLNTLFIAQIPDAFKGLWEWVADTFTNLKDTVWGWLLPILNFFGYEDPAEDLAKASESTEKAADEASVVENAMKSIGNIFDGAAKWINNALSKISGHRYTKSDGSKARTDDSKIAGTIPKINIDAGGSANAWYSRTAANGFSGMVNSPTMFMAGEAGSEYVNVSPHGNKSGATPVININIARIDKNADFEQLKPAIQRWILEANSRRGMI